MRKYEVLSLGVDGTIYRTGKYAEVKDELNDADVFKSLQKVGFLSNQANENSIEIDDGGADWSLYINDAQTGEPLLQMSEIY
jgi:hypothetical protein